MSKPLGEEGCCFAGFCAPKRMASSASSSASVGIRVASALAAAVAVSRARILRKSVWISAMSSTRRMRRLSRVFMGP